MSPDDLRDLAAGAGDPLEVAEVASTLSRLWATAGGLGKERIVRACQANLVLWGLPAGGTALERRIEEMTRVRPVRVMLLEQAAAGSPVRARISALCHLRGVGERICCEKIILNLPAGSEDLAVGAVRSLLRGDVPVFLWSPEEPPFDLPAFADLCGDANLLLVDSSRFADSRAGLKRLLRLREQSGGLHPLDWTWKRLAGWRHAVARAFHPLPERERIPSIRRIRIGGSADGRGPVSASVLLLAGWMRGCLQRPDVSLELEPGEIRAVEFVFASGPPVSIPSLPEIRSEGDESARLADFLASRDGDRAFESALGSAALL